LSKEVLSYHLHVGRRKSLRSASARTRRTSILTFAFLLIVVGGMVAVAATVRVSSATIIAGTIGESASVTPIVLPTGGRVAQILTKNGEVVEKNQDLFILADDGLVDQRGDLNDQLSVYLIKDARITAELAGASTFELPGELASRASESSITKASTLQQQQLDNDNANLEATEKALQTQLSSQDAILMTLQQQQASAVKNALDPAYSGSPASAYASQIEATQTQIAQITSQIAQARASVKANLLEVASDNQELIIEAKSKVGQLDTQLAALHIKAPSRGIVSQSILSESGQYLPPSTAAMKVVGDGGGTVITAKLPVADAPFVVKGDSVLVDLTTGDKLRSTSVQGTIRTISANPSSPGKSKSGATYDVEVVVSDKAAAGVSSATALANGMPVQVHVEGGSRSILTYLVSPIVERLRFAFHER
jgi:HlyD family secretion protein